MSTTTIPAPSRARTGPAAPAALCPLCGQANRCAVAAGQPAADCWCMAQAIAPEALAALPPHARGRACICAACGSCGAGPTVVDAAQAAPPI